MPLLSLSKWLTHELGLSTLLHANPDIHLILLTRFIRLTAYGSTSLILALLLRAQSFTDAQIGLFMSLTLLGDVLISLLLTLMADTLGRRNMLFLGAVSMALSGVVFATSGNYHALLAAAIIGVISPGGNEIGPFRAVEESTLAQLVGEEEEKRADVYTWYVVLAVLGTSTGVAVGGVVVDGLLAREGWEPVDAYRGVFWIYAGVGAVKAVLTLGLSEGCECEEWRGKGVGGGGEREPLLVGSGETSTTLKKEKKKKKRFWHAISMISPASRLVLIQLCSLFFLDSLGSGMVPFSLINYYMDRKFNLPKGKLGGIMSATWFASTLGTVFASSLSKRLGLIQAMVITHLPASIFLALLPIPSSLALTICLLVGRSILSSMDQAPRSAFLSIVVRPEERTAVMGVVNVLKTLSQSSGPSVTGVLAGSNHFWVGFVAAGSLKATYDFLLLVFFGGRVKPKREESEQVDGTNEGEGQRSNA